MKKYLEKILIVFLILLIVFNFTINSVVASQDPLIGDIEEKYGSTESYQKFKDSFNAMAAAVQGLGIIADAVLILPRMMALVAGLSLQGIISSFLGMAGINVEPPEDGEEPEPQFMLATPYDIIFNKYKITDIDYFNIEDPDLSDGVVTIRKSVAGFYYIIRMIATAILLIVLIYIGIRMALSTIASEQAKFKQMLVDWAVSLALLFVLHYMMIIIININTSLVTMLKDIAESALTEPGKKFVDFSADLFTKSIGFGLRPIITTILYGMILMQTLIFLVTYIKRMLTVGFLIIISPLITITYSIDRIADGKSQVLSTWLKEFTYNILIQPFHCILYLAMVGTAINVLDSTDVSGMGACVFALVCLKFLKDGEEIIRNIFGFKNASSLGTIAASAAVTAAVLKNSKQIAGGAAKAGLKIPYKTSAALNKLGNKKLGFKNKKAEEDNRQTLSEAFNDSKLGEAVQGLKDTASGLKGKIDDKIQGIKDNDKVKGFDKALEDATGINLNDLKPDLKGAAGIGLGMLTAGMAYQQSGAFDAITVGAVTGQSVNEIMSKTKGSLKKNIRKNISSTKRDGETEDQRLREVHAKGSRGAFSDIQKQLEKAMKEILKGQEGKGSDAALDTASSLLIYQLAMAQKKSDGKQLDYDEIADKALADTFMGDGRKYSELEQSEKNAYKAKFLSLDKEVKYTVQVPKRGSDGKIVRDEEGNEVKEDVVREGTLRDTMEQYARNLADIEIYKNMQIGDGLAREYGIKGSVFIKPDKPVSQKSSSNGHGDPFDKFKSDIENDINLLDTQLDNIKKNLEDGSLNENILSSIRDLLTSKKTSTDTYGTTTEIRSTTSEITQKILNNNRITEEEITFLQEIQRFEQNGTAISGSSYINSNNTAEKLAAIQSLKDKCEELSREQGGSQECTDIIIQLDDAKVKLETI